MMDDGGMECEKMRWGVVTMGMIYGDEGLG
jgi:hypothetical protein